MDEIGDRSLKINANILGSNYSDLKFIRFAFLHRRKSIMCVCVIVKCMCSTGCQGCNNRGGCCWEEEGGSFDQRSFNSSLLLRCFCTSAACKHRENVVFVLVYECVFGVIY